MLFFLIVVTAVLCGALTGFRRTMIAVCVVFGVGLAWFLVGTAVHPLDGEDHSTLPGMALALAPLALAIPVAAGAAIRAGLTRARPKRP